LISRPADFCQVGYIQLYPFIKDISLMDVLSFCKFNSD